MLVQCLDGSAFPLSRAAASLSKYLSAVSPDDDGAMQVDEDCVLVSVGSSHDIQRILNVLEAIVQGGNGGEEVERMREIPRALQFGCDHRDTFAVGPVAREFVESIADDVELLTRLIEVEFSHSPFMDLYLSLCSDCQLLRL